MLVVIGMGGLEQGGDDGGNGEIEKVLLTEHTLDQKNTTAEQTIGNLPSAGSE